MLEEREYIKMGRTFTKLEGQKNLEEYENGDR